MVKRDVRILALKNFLSKRKPVILQKWFDLLLEGYLPETARFLRGEKDQFANPVGNAIYEGMEGIFEELLRGINTDRVHPFLDKIIRIRAVQDVSPSLAVAWIFLLKRVIREELADASRDSSYGFPEVSVPERELLKLELDIDNLALLGFDIYVSCREKIYEIRINEMKRRTARLLQRANLLDEATPTRFEGSPKQVCSGS